MTGTKRPLSGEKEVSQCKSGRSIRNNIQSSQVNKILFKNLRNQQISQQMLVKYSKNFVSLIFSVLPNIFCVYFHLIISFYILTFLIKCVQVLKRIPKFKIKFPEVHQLPSEIPNLKGSVGSSTVQQVTNSSQANLFTTAQ